MFQPGSRSSPLTSPHRRLLVSALGATVIDWRHGGWTGSVNRFARREVRQHLRDNPAARRTRYTLARRIAHRFSGLGTFGRLVGLYIVVDIAAMTTEALVSWGSLCAVDCLPEWTAFNADDSTFSETKLRGISGYLIGAQVGALGVITLALALVTLIARGANSSTDIRIYYHESLAFQVVASCLALLAVLITQLIWPIQLLLHSHSLGTENLLFEFALFCIHLVWLLLNLYALSYFITTTFRFVQQSTRESLRESYTCNVVLPRDLMQRLREHLYNLGTVELQTPMSSTGRNQPSGGFGIDYGAPYTIELQTTFARPHALSDVRMTWVNWVIRRWLSRCDQALQSSPTTLAGTAEPDPLIWFTPRIDHELHGNVGWCRRRGGVPLTSLEKLVIRCAFVYRRHNHEA